MTTTEGGVTVVRIEGPVELTADAVAALRPELEQAMDVAGAVVLDLGAVEFLDSAGLGLLVALNRRARRRGGELRLASPGREARTTLELTRMHRLFETYDTVGAAVASFRVPAEGATG